MSETEETVEAVTILIEALGDAAEALTGTDRLVDLIRRRPGLVPENEVADLYAWACAVLALAQQIHGPVGSVLKSRCIMSGPIVTSNGAQGWKATSLGHASRMGGTYRLDPLGSVELGELT